MYLTKKNKKIKIKAITSDKLNLVAKRPLYSKLDNQNLLRYVNMPIKSWRYYLKMLLT